MKRKGLKFWEAQRLKEGGNIVADYLACRLLSIRRDYRWYAFGGRLYTVRQDAYTHMDVGDVELNRPHPMHFVGMPPMEDRQMMGG